MSDEVNNPIQACLCPCDVAILIVYHEQPILIPFDSVQEKIPLWSGIDIRESMRETFTDFNSNPPLSYQESAIGLRVSGLGHAGIALIDGCTGEAEYYEYGRYDPEMFGEVRNADATALAQLKIQFNESGNPTLSSFNSLISILTKTNNGPYAFKAVYIKLENGAFQIMKRFSDRRLKDISARESAPYDVADNHCFTFVTEVAAEVGVNVDVSEASDLEIKLVGGNQVSRTIISSMAPKFEIPARQMIILQTRYRALNVSTNGNVVNDFEFPTKLNAK